MQDKAALVHLGRDEEVRRARAELLQRKPDFTCSLIKKTYFGAVPELINPIIEGLRKAGLPE